MSEKNESAGFSCDWSAGKPSAPGDNRSALYRFREGFHWDGVEQQRYKTPDGSWMEVARQVLIGERGESARFDLRYFEIAPGGHSTLEVHDHEHVVIGLRGRGRTLLAGEMVEIGFLDTLYVCPEDPHQLLNPFDEPFGFFCIVNHERDRPRPLNAQQAEALRARGCDVRGEESP